MCHDHGFLSFPSIFGVLCKLTIIITPCIFLLCTGPNTTGMWTGGARLAGKSSLKSCFSQRMLSARRFHGGACSMWHTIRQRCWNADSELRLETATCFKRRHLSGCCQAHSNWQINTRLQFQPDYTTHNYFIISGFPPHGNYTYILFLLLNVMSDWFINKYTIVYCTVNQTFLKLLLHLQCARCKYGCHHILVFAVLTSMLTVLVWTLLGKKKSEKKRSENSNSLSISREREESTTTVERWREKKLSSFNMFL